MNKKRKAELVMETMRWHASRGRYVVLQDTMFVGPTRALVKEGRLEGLKDRAGQWCVRWSVGAAWAPPQSSGVGAIECAEWIAYVEIKTVVGTMKDVG